MLPLTLSEIHLGATRAWENTVLSLNPSAERAYAYGVVHFSSSQRDAYDIDRAEYFFRRAIALNNRQPLAYHQLARIAFLRGEFSQAMTYINNELFLNPEPSPSSYYMRGLIRGYMGDYPEAVTDYQMYLTRKPANWAGFNDFAWVLVKDNRPAEAWEIVLHGLASYPTNPWLLNTGAIASYELGETERARSMALDAARFALALSEKDWLVAYPGNDPAVAQEGISTLYTAIMQNIHRASVVTATPATQTP